MLRDGEQLDMGEAKIGHIRNELPSEFIIGEELPVVPAHPRAEMNLIDRHRLAPRITAPAPIEEIRVGPDEAPGMGNDRRCQRPQFARKADRIGFQRQKTAVIRDDFIFVDGAFLYSGRENLPKAGIDALAHLVSAPIPGIEVANDRDSLRARRPNREMHPIDPFELHGMRPEPFIELAMSAFNEEVIIGGAKHRREGVGIDEFPLSARVRRPQPIGKPAHPLLDKTFEKAASRSRHQAPRHGLRCHFESHAAQARRRDPRGAPQARLAPCHRRSATVGSR